MRVVIAGATGLAGSALVAEFETQGYEVIPISRTHVDLMDNAATKGFLKDLAPSLVVDAAAKVGGIGANDSYPVEFLIDNIRIQTNLMQAAHEANVEKFIFLGSSCIYPRNCPQPIKEEYLMSGPLEATNSAYAISKIAGLELVNSYRKEYGHNWISLMPTNLYGPRDNFNLQSAHVLPAFIRRFIEATEDNASSVSVWGSGAPMREFLHVTDFAKAVVLSAKEYNSSTHLNIGTGEDMTIKALALLIASLTGYKGEIIWDETKPDGTPRKVLDVSRIKAMGWTPTTTLSDGILSTIAWYKSANSRGEVRK